MTSSIKVEKNHSIPNPWKYEVIMNCTKLPIRKSQLTLHSLMAFMSRSFSFSLDKYSGSKRTLKQVCAVGSLKWEWERHNNAWSCVLNWFLTFLSQIRSLRWWVSVWPSLQQGSCHCPSWTAKADACLPGPSHEPLPRTICITNHVFNSQSEKDYDIFTHLTTLVSLL